MLWSASICGLSWRLGITGRLDGVKRFLQRLEGGAEARVVLQNLSPQRQPVRWPPGWLADAPNELGPWQIGSWRLRCAAKALQSS